MELRNRSHLLFLLIPIILMAGCGVAPRVEEGTMAAYVRLPYVRVLLEAPPDRAEIRCNGDFAIEGRYGAASRIYHATTPLEIRRDDGWISVFLKGVDAGSRFDELLVRPTGRNFLNYNGRVYRGMIRVLVDYDRLLIINVVHIDDYLKGVVPPEIGKIGHEEMEAARAQALAARTYAMSHLDQYPGKPYDMKADVSDQVYHGVTVEDRMISKAIDETRGEVIRFHDHLIKAYYHSTCGGMTDNNDEVWDKAPEPYLRAVADSQYCSWSKYYRWRENFTAGELKERIESYFSGQAGHPVRIGEILDIYVQKKTTGGRVTRLKVITSTDTYLFGSDKIRWVFRRASDENMILQSARFDLETHYDEQGNLTGATFVGSGYGHGVGMCQCGAIGMARSGWKYRNIIKFFYRGVEIVRLY